MDYSKARLTVFDPNSSSPWLYDFGQVLEPVGFHLFICKNENDSCLAHSALL